MPTRKPMIGIAGGVGPFAGIDLAQKIMQETIAGKDQEHLPLILLSVPDQICDRTEYLAGNTAKNPALALSRVLTQLAEAGATVASIPCNTAHAPAIFDVIKNELKEKNTELVLLNMISEVTDFIKQHYPGKKAGVLSTMGTWKNKVYQQAFEETGISQVLLNEEEQQAVHSSIYHPVFGIKAQSDPVSEEAMAILHEHAEILIARGAELIVLGCTEIPLALKEDQLNGIPLIDANRVLGRSLINWVAPEKLKKQDK